MASFLRKDVGLSERLYPEQIRPLGVTGATGPAGETYQVYDWMRVLAGEDSIFQKKLEVMGDLKVQGLESGPYLSNGANYCIWDYATGSFLSLPVGTAQYGSPLDATGGPLAQGSELDLYATAPNRAKFPEIANVTSFITFAPDPNETVAPVIEVEVQMCISADPAGADTYNVNVANDILPSAGGGFQTWGGKIEQSLNAGEHAVWTGKFVKEYASPATGGYGPNIKVYITTNGAPRTIQVNAFQLKVRRLR